MPIKTFKGSIDDEEQIDIRISTSQGKVGYKIKKLQIIVTDPFVAACKLVFKVYTTKQTTIDALVDFADQTLIGVATYHDQPVAEDMAESTVIIYENFVFNQDVFITMADVGVNAKSASYYLELEQVKLDEHEAAVATLKDMRGSP